MRILLVLGAAALLVAGGAAGWLAARETESTETITDTTTATETRIEEAAGLPDAVDETRLALLAAARAGDYEALRPLIPTDGFEYTFGDAVAGGPIPYWRELERTTNERPLETLAALLEMPYVLTRGLYVWPWAYIATSESDLSAHERDLLAPVRGLNETIVEGTGYLGWRAGIEPNGDWVFFVAGD